MIYWNGVTLVILFPVLFAWSVAESIDLFHRVSIAADAYVDPFTISTYKAAVSLLPVGLSFLAVLWLALVRKTAYRYHLGERRQHSRQALGGVHCFCCPQYHPKLVWLKSPEGYSVSLRL